MGRRWQVTEGTEAGKDIRAFSDFGYSYSYIYIILDEGTDIYWARSRTLEHLNSVIPRLPKGMNVELAKDATAVGWVYQYALVDGTGQYLMELIVYPPIFAIWKWNWEVKPALTRKVEAQEVVHAD